MSVIRMYRMNKESNKLFVAWRQFISIVIYTNTLKHVISKFHTEYDIQNDNDNR